MLKWPVIFFKALHTGQLLSAAALFQKYFQKNPSGILSGCQTVGIDTRKDGLSVLIWVQTFCKGYQCMIEVESTISGKATHDHLN